MCVVLCQGSRQVRWFRFHPPGRDGTGTSQNPARRSDAIAYRSSSPAGRSGVLHRWSAWTTESGTNDSSGRCPVVADGSHRARRPGRLRRTAGASSGRGLRRFGWWSQGRRRGVARARLGWRRWRGPSGGDRRPFTPVYPHGGEEALWCTGGVSPLVGPDEAISPPASQRPDSQRRRTLP
jgi:hypothetical protein